MPAPAVPTLNQVLSTQRIQRIVEDLQDVRGISLPAFAGRVADQSADESEILAKITSRILAADVIADNGRARVRPSDPIRMTETKVPNLKHGMNFNQEKLNLLHRLVSGEGRVADLKSVDSFLSNSLGTLLDGIAVRRAALVCAMAADDSSYNGFGIQWSNMTWGMPSDLKTTLASNRRWIGGNESTALPITDINTILDTARDKYGIVYNRITMPRALLLFIVTTDEFKAMAAVWQTVSVPAGYQYGNLPSPKLVELVGKILDIEIELEDTVYYTENMDGTQVTNRYFNAADVVFSNTQFDGRTAVWDFANAIVTESIVGGMGSNQMVIGGFSGPQEGPVGYAIGSPDLNPPDITVWAVQRGFPRKHMETATARLRTTS